MGWKMVVSLLCVVGVFAVGCQKNQKTDAEKAAGVDTAGVMSHMDTTERDTARKFQPAAVLPLKNSKILRIARQKAAALGFSLENDRTEFLLDDRNLMWQKSLVSYMRSRGHSSLLTTEDKLNGHSYQAVLCIEKEPGKNRRMWIFVDMITGEIITTFPLR